jgi:tetratricopeptide (TPR) repeat protein
MTGREEVFKKAMNDGHSAAWDQAWEKAAGFYQIALDEFPQDAKALNSLGLALFELQRLEESQQTYQRASQVTPDDPLPFERIAYISERLGQIKPAVQAALRAADLYVKSKNIEKAIENWLMVTQIAPDNAQAHLNLAMVQSKLGKTAQAGVQYLALASSITATPPRQAR